MPNAELIAVKTAGGRNRDGFRSVLARPGLHPTRAGIVAASPRIDAFRTGVLSDQDYCFERFP